MSGLTSNGDDLAAIGSGMINGTIGCWLALCVGAGIVAVVIRWIGAM